jgi:hypothetical protein
VKTILKERIVYVPGSWRQYASPVCWLSSVRLDGAIHNVNITLWIYFGGSSRGGVGGVDVNQLQQLFVIHTNEPTRCNNFSSLLLDVCLQLNMFRASSRPSSEAQQLQ